MKFLPGMSVKIRKLSESPYPAYQAAAWTHFTPGQPCQDSESLPIGYELEGVLQAAIEVGESIQVWRKVRNGIEVDGVFVSSPVMDVQGNRVTTLSSIYRVDLLTDDGGVA